MSPRLPQGIAEMDREFEELAADATMAGREQLTIATSTILFESYCLD